MAETDTVVARPWVCQYDGCPAGPNDPPCDCNGCVGARLQAENEALRRERDEANAEAERLSHVASESFRIGVEHQAAREAAEAKAARLEERKDDAYRERNQVVAALARLFPSGLARTDIPGWSSDWHGCVYIDLPTGQVSWHFHDSQADLFAGLPAYSGSWDGHDTDEKYRRLAALEA